MSRNRNTCKNIPRNTDTRLTALAAPSVPCFILTPANPAQLQDSFRTILLARDTQRKIGQIRPGVKTQTKS